MDHFEYIKHTLRRMMPNDWQFVDDALIGQFRRDDGRFWMTGFPDKNGLMGIHTFARTGSSGDSEKCVDSQVFDPSSRRDTAKMFRSLLTRQGASAWSTWTRQRRLEGTRLYVNFRSHDLSFLNILTVTTVTPSDCASHDTLQQARSAAIREWRQNNATLHWLEGIVFPPPTNPFAESVQ
jgi:hypothetical protein